MAEENKKILTLPGLTHYDEQIKTHIQNLITDVQEEIDNKAEKVHSHDDVYYTQTEIDSKIEESKTYAETAASTVKNDLLNGAGEAYDTLKELGDLIETNHDAIDALETIATGKADKEHTHEISDVTGLQDELNSKASVQIITWEADD